MHSTKTDILAILKRTDGSTVDELASELGLASMTVRQHLTALERDGVVGSQEVRQPMGRPRFRFRLTEDGHRRVSVGHDRMLTLLVEQAGRLEPANLEGQRPDERRARLFELAAGALAERNRAAIVDLSPADQVARAVALLRSHGGFADWHEVSGVFEVRDFGCVYRGTVGMGDSCAWHETFLSAMLGCDVRPAVEPADCAACCRYTIAMPPPRMTNGR